MNHASDLKAMLQRIDATLPKLQNLCALLARNINHNIRLKVTDAATLHKHTGLSRHIIRKALHGGCADVLERARILDAVFSAMLRTADLSRLTPAALHYLRKTQGGLSMEAAAAGLKIELSRLRRLEAGRIKPTREEIGNIKKFYAQFYQVAAEHGDHCTPP